jgi:hypothetical protein
MEILRAREVRKPGRHPGRPAARCPAAGHRPSALRNQLTIPTVPTLPANLQDSTTKARRAIDDRLRVLREPGSFRRVHNQRHEARGAIGAAGSAALGPRLVAPIVYEAHGTWCTRRGAGLDTEDLPARAAGWGEKGACALPSPARSRRGLPLRVAQILARYRVVGRRRWLAWRCEAIATARSRSRAILHLARDTSRRQASGRSVAAATASTVRARCSSTSRRLQGPYHHAEEPPPREGPAAPGWACNRAALSDGSRRAAATPRPFPGYIAAAERLAVLVDERTI